MSTERDDNGTASRPHSEEGAADAFGLPNTADDRGLRTLADNIARLEIDLDSEKEERREERFIWIATVALVLDPSLYRICESLPAFLLIFVLQIIILLGIARRLGVDWAVRLLGLMLHWATSRIDLK